MSLLNLIFDIDCGGLSRELPDDEDEGPPASYSPPAPTVCACNNCGRTYHETWLHCYCPARCGGRIYIK